MSTTQQQQIQFTVDMDYCERYDFNGYVLAIDDKGFTNSMGKARLAYRLTDPNGKVLFEGCDFCASPMHSSDGIESALGLMGFLTLRKGDTDQDYFDNYTEEQLAFSENEAEQLQAYLYELEELVSNGEEDKARELTLADDIATDETRSYGPRG